jgi:hypothetical protein
MVCQVSPDNLEFGQTSPEYQVKNTFVEIEIPCEEKAGQMRRVNSWSNNEKEQIQDEHPALTGHLSEYLAAGTPSPFLHPAKEPANVALDMQMMPNPFMLCGDGLMMPADGEMPIAFGDFSLDNCYPDNQLSFAAAQLYTYDPATGMWGFNCADWPNVEQFNPEFFMTGDMQEGGMTAEDYGLFPCGNDVNSMLAELEQKIDADKELTMSYDCSDGSAVLPNAYMECGEAMDGSQLNGDMEGYGSTVEKRDRKTRKGRNRERERECADRNDYSTVRVSMETIAQNEAEAPVTFTTVMFRNIPNKYTREMLVKQLEENLKGEFDFVYLPIDFKNQCNVGYAFINFRTIEACQSFMDSFNGMEVCKCLPGLNSRKITEVTPARVQGFEENVQRLRNSPVMRELTHRPEWMPLIFDENGDELPFPQPERPLDPIKPSSRRQRNGAGAGYAGA